MAIQTITLDEKHLSMVAQSRGSVQVRDQAGGLPVQIVPSGAIDGQCDKDRWIECWNEWYSETA